MNSDELKGLVSRLTDEAITGLLLVIGDEVKARTEARNAALPDDVWLTARQGNPSQVTRAQANQLVEAGTHEIVTAPQGDEPTDLVWVSTKLGHVVRCPRPRRLNCWTRVPTGWPSRKSTRKHNVGCALPAAIH